MKAFIYSFFAFLSLVYGEIVSASVVEEVEGYLSESGILLGFNSKTDTFVSIGSKEQEIPRNSSTSTLLKLRNSALKVAMRNARAEIMKTVSSQNSAKRLAKSHVENEIMRETFESLMEVFSSTPLYACEAICLREEMKENSYRVAVAVSWSKGVEKEALASMRGEIDLSRVSKDNEWKAWCETVDFSTPMYAYSFIGKDGVRRYVGIGVADYENKSGKAAVDAMRVARVSATANLAYELFGETEARALASRVIVSLSNGQGQTRVTTIEQFESSILQTVKNKILKDDEVYTTTVVHPLTGRKMFVSVAGIEPDTLAEMKLLTVSP